MESSGGSTLLASVPKRAQYSDDIGEETTRPTPSDQDFSTEMQQLLTSRKVKGENDDAVMEESILDLSVEELHFWIGTTKAHIDPDLVTKTIRAVRDAEPETEEKRATIERKRLERKGEIYHSMMITKGIYEHVGQRIWEQRDPWLDRDYLWDWFEYSFHRARIDKRSEGFMPYNSGEAWVAWRDWVFTDEAQRELPGPIWHAFRSAFAEKRKEPFLGNE